MSSEEVINQVKVLENYLFRLKICQRPTNGLNRIIAALCSTAGNSIAKEYQLLSGTFPRDRLFRESLQKTNLYKLRNNLTKLALVSLEEKRTKETIDFEDAQVEHIMPQHLTADWRLQVKNADIVNERLGGTLGNLTLTKYNQELSNQVFAKKKAYYKNSNITLTRDVARNFSEWDANAITARSKELNDELIKIFPKPDFDKQNTREIAGEYSIADEVSATGTKPRVMVVGDTKQAVKTWKGALISLLNALWDMDSSNIISVKNDPVLNKKLFSSSRHLSGLKNGMQIETNYSANDILAIMTKVTEVCGMTDQVSYIIK
ncbi:HNH endonuclease family protein [Lactobacillus sp. ESL0791]|uniref:HNH endonuclease family protein n=1 Tax=Lactobacillus sp. ESL0791 TaxID=2983234 RepID=UPI0023F6BA23|nr:HNH endonuclease family protein [Lactobacillus sp. ESL0791]MDF7639278.1 HNH endonuclease family protein [Lactobacillus sp. ESL0791]